jgi:hypothetical protein
MVAFVPDYSNVNDETDYRPAQAAKLELSEFSGIHGHLSHKASLYQFARRYFPRYFTSVHHPKSKVHTT